MYQRPRFLEELHEIRAEMSRECDYDLDLFAEMVRSGQNPKHGPARNIRGRRVYVPVNPLIETRQETTSDERWGSWED